MPVESLYELSEKACIYHLKSLHDVGDTPYDVLRPILLHLENPFQLMELEKKSPQLRGVDAELWREFMKRDIPHWETKPHEPKDPRNWYKLYMRLREEAAVELGKETAKITSAFQNIKAERSKSKVRMIDVQVPNKRFRGRTGGPDRLAKYKLESTAGKKFLAKTRQEFRERSFLLARKNNMNVPTHLLNTGTSCQQDSSGAIVGKRRGSLVGARIGQQSNEGGLRKTASLDAASDSLSNQKIKQHHRGDQADQVIHAGLAPPSLPPTPKRVTIVRKRKPVDVFMRSKRTKI